MANRAQRAGIVFWLCASCSAALAGAGWTGPTSVSPPVSVTPLWTVRLSNEITDVAFSSDGSLVAACGMIFPGDVPGFEGWDTRTGKVKFRLRSPEGADHLALADGGLRVAGCYNKGSGEGEGFRSWGKLELWDLRHGRRLLTRSRQVSALAFSPDGRLLFTGGDSGVEIWDGKSLRRMGTLRTQGGGAALAFAPDGKILAVGCIDSGTVELWDVPTRRRQRVLEYDDPAYEVNITSLSLASHPELLAMGTNWTPAAIRHEPYPGRIAVWDYRSGNRVRALAQPSNAVSVALFPGGRTLVSGGGDGTFRLWDIATGRSAVYGTRSRFTNVRVTISPDGKLLAAGDANGVLKVWRVQEQGP